MRRIIISIIALVALTSLSASAQKFSKGHVVGFYNLENLFDTYHDDGKNDYQFLPDGENNWTEAKYEKKLHNMASVIRAMADDNGRYHSILGISEIENRHVVEDLVSQPEIADANFQIVHYDGPDRRGVDVALLYRPEHFKVLESRSIPFTFEGSAINFTLNAEEQADFRTRDILMVRGMLDDEMFAFFVAHLPSRVGGKGQDLRPRGAEIIYGNAVALMSEFPGIKIVVMGDMNDNPTDESMTTYMHGRETIAETGELDFFSPFISMLKAGYGSLAYRGEWSIYDIILMNKALADAPKGTFQVLPIIKKKKAEYYARIFQQPFMTQQDGPYKGTPYRTFSNGAFVGGYSDHYPTYIIIGK
ncbi:MAG: endonuclease/exonuclease/phosphatase family protein [Bacteroidales bacterium]|nr:endonuclease/exonuclease/phosphatase family protein [Candidatus Cryptobacteroides onthequi]